MSERPEPEPEDPQDTGVPEGEPEDTQIEPARLLANEARDELTDRGFTDDQIDRWARTYVSEVGPGDVPTFIEWIDRRQRGADADDMD